MKFSEFLYREKFPLAFLGLLLAALYAEIVPSMVTEWNNDDNYSHGFIVPFIAGYFLYMKRSQLLAKEVSSSWIGLPVICVGVVQLLIGWLGTEYFTMRSSLIIILAGIVLYFFGIEVFKICRFSISYLILMVPIPYIIYDAAAFPLKLFVTKISVTFLKFAGVTSLREGNIIMFPAFTLEVADACSGIRSLMSLIALSVAYAYFLKISTIKRWVIISSAIPIAIFANALRVIITGILAQWFGEAAAKGFFHEFAGLTIFALAIGMLIGIGAILSRERSAVK